MANELAIRNDSGKGAYALIRNMVNQVWNGSTFVTYNGANITSYDIPLVEQGTSGYYIGDMPALSEGFYSVEAFGMATSGSIPAEGDTSLGGAQFSWSGTAIVSGGSGVSDIFTEVIEPEGSNPTTHPEITFKESLKLFLSFFFGLNDRDTINNHVQVTFRDINDRVDRLVMELKSHNDRVAVTRDVTDP